MDNTFSEGVIQPLVVGKFEGNVGTFEGYDTFDGKPILVRFTWTLDTEPQGFAGRREMGAGVEPRRFEDCGEVEQAF